MLLGAGHAHLHVLRELARRPLAGVEPTLVAPYPRHHYSGMVPGYLQGTYSERELSFDLERLCRAAGSRFVTAFAEHIDPAARVVSAGDARYAFDALSVDVGSDALGRETPGVREHAYTVRPMTRAIALRAGADQVIATARERSVHVCVVGGGAAGIEVAFALHRRIARMGGTPEVGLLEGGPSVLADYAPRARRRVLRILAARGIGVTIGRSAVEVTPAAVVLDSGARVRSDLTVWLTGAAAPPLLRASPLPKDGRDFLLVDATLRAVDGSPVWGAGDCVALADHPATPKAGVYAVREAPVLERNLRAALTGAPPTRYTPQASFLALLNTADGKAFLRWRGLVSHSRWAWWLKDWIDRRFMRGYHDLA